MIKTASLKTWILFLIMCSVLSAQIVEPPDSLTIRLMQYDSLRIKISKTNSWKEPPFGLAGFSLHSEDAAREAGRISPKAEKLFLQSQRNDRQVFEGLLSMLGLLVATPVYLGIASQTKVHPAPAIALPVIAYATGIFAITRSYASIRRRKEACRIYEADLRNSLHITDSTTSLTASSGYQRYLKNSIRVSVTEQNGGPLASQMVCNGTLIPTYSRKIPELSYGELASAFGKYSDLARKLVVASRECSRHVQSVRLISGIALAGGLCGLFATCFGAIMDAAVEDDARNVLPLFLISGTATIAGGTGCFITGSIRQRRSAEALNAAYIQYDKDLRARFNIGITAPIPSP